MKNQSKLIAIIVSIIFVKVIFVVAQLVYDLHAMHNLYGRDISVSVLMLICNIDFAVLYSKVWDFYFSCFL